MFKLKELRGLLVLTLLLAVAVDLFGRAQDRTGHDVDAAVDQARRQLLPGDLLAPPDNGAVEVLELDARLPVRALLRSLPPGTGSNGITLYDLPGAREFSAAAQGVDQSPHIVNAYLQGYAPFVPRNLWTPLFALARRKTYMTDELQYAGRKEVWQTSKQAFHHTRGDCEDHAIMLADWLSTLGHDARVALGKHENEGHAWVILFHEGRQLILEATQKSGVQQIIYYPLASTLPEYHPMYMFNRSHFWTNTGSIYTTQYQSAAWVKKSRFYNN